MGPRRFGAAAPFPFPFGTVDRSPPLTPAHHGDRPRLPAAPERISRRRGPRRGRGAAGCGRWPSRVRAPTARGGSGAAAGRRATARPAGRRRGGRRRSGAVRPGGGGGGRRVRRAGAWTQRGTVSSERTAAERGTPLGCGARRISARGVSLGVQRLVLAGGTAGGNTLGTPRRVVPPVFGAPRRAAARAAEPTAGPDPEPDPGPPARVSILTGKDPGTLWGGERQGDMGEDGDAANKSGRAWGQAVAALVVVPVPVPVLGLGLWWWGGGRRELRPVEAAHMRGRGHREDARARVRAGTVRSPVPPRTRRPAGRTGSGGADGERRQQVVPARRHGRGGRHADRQGGVRGVHGDAGRRLRRPPRGPHRRADGRHRAGTHRSGPPGGPLLGPDPADPVPARRGATPPAARACRRECCRWPRTERTRAIRSN